VAPLRAAPSVSISGQADETNADMLKKLLYFSSATEAATGLVLVINPAIVVTLLLGVEVSGVGIPLGMCFGIALLALGLACWPSGALVQTNSPAFRAMLVYNALIAPFLAYLFVAGPFAGVLLWPAVAVHALVALLMAWTWIVERRTPRNL